MGQVDLNGPGDPHDESGLPRSRAYRILPTPDREQEPRNHNGNHQKPFRPFEHVPGPYSRCCVKHRKRAVHHLRKPKGHPTIRWTRSPTARGKRLSVMIAGFRQILVAAGEDRERKSNSKLSVHIGLLLGATCAMQFQHTGGTQLRQSAITREPSLRYHLSIMRDHLAVTSARDSPLSSQATTDRPISPSFRGGSLAYTLRRQPLQDPAERQAFNVPPCNCSPCGWDPGRRRSLCPHRARSGR